MTTPLALLGLDVGSIIRDAVKALVDLIVPDLGADWTSHVVSWLVALPDVTGPQFPHLTAYARDVTAIGFGLLGATTVAGALQHYLGRPATALHRAAISAGVLTSYPTIMHTTITATNLITAAMVTHPEVRHGLDSAFGEALIAGAITTGVSVGLAAGAAFALLYFLAALFVLKIGLTTALAVAVITGGIVWGLYPLPQTAWLAQAWTATLVAVLAVPVTWAAIFAAAALLAADTLEFTGLTSDLAALVKPFAAVACFWLAYKSPHMLLSVARHAGMPTPMPHSHRSSSPPTGRSPEAMVHRAVNVNVERFGKLTTRTPTPSA